VNFPEDARQSAGYQLDLVQKGKQPLDFKPMPSIGKGVEELGFGMTPARIVLSTQPDLPARYMCFMHFRRSAGNVSKRYRDSPESDLRN